MPAYLELCIPARVGNVGVARRMTVPFAVAVLATSILAAPPDHQSARTEVHGVQLAALAPSGAVLQEFLVDKAQAVVGGTAMVVDGADLTARPTPLEVVVAVEQNGSPTPADQSLTDLSPAQGNNTAAAADTDIINGVLNLIDSLPEPVRSAVLYLVVLPGFFFVVIPVFAVLLTIFPPTFPEATDADLVASAQGVPAPQTAALAEADPVARPAPQLTEPAPSDEQIDRVTSGEQQTSDVDQARLGEQAAGTDPVTPAEHLTTEQEATPITEPTSRSAEAAESARDRPLVRGAQGASDQQQDDPPQDCPGHEPNTSTGPSDEAPTGDSSATASEPPAGDTEEATHSTV